MFPYALSKFQTDAIEWIQSGPGSVLVTAHTGNGKTTVAEASIEWAWSRGFTAIFTAPIKALSNQKWSEWRVRFPHWECGLITGDVRINSESRVIICTTEILRNWLANSDLRVGPERLGVVVFDEVHWISDAARGEVWEDCLIMLGRRRPICKIVMLSATVGNSDQLANWVTRLQGGAICKVCSTNERVVPLVWQELGADWSDFVGLGEGMNESIGRRGDEIRSILELVSLKERTPCIWFKLSKLGCESAVKSCVHGLISAVEGERLVGIWRGLIPGVYRDLWTSLQIEEGLRLGLAYHHSGMIPALKEAIEQMFGMGLIKVLFATETLAMGINMPTRSVILEGRKKPYKVGDDTLMFRELTYSEIIQMAGRAGRRGKDKIGYVIWIGGRGFDMKGWLERGTPMKLVSQRYLTNMDSILLMLGGEKLSVSEICERNWRDGFGEVWKKLEGHQAKVEKMKNIWDEWSQSWIGGKKPEEWIGEWEEWEAQLKGAKSRKAREKIEFSSAYVTWSKKNRRAIQLYNEWLRIGLDDKRYVDELRLYIEEAAHSLCEWGCLVKGEEKFELTKLGKALTCCPDFKVEIWSKLLVNEEWRDSLRDWGDFCACLAYYIGWDVREGEEEGEGEDEVVKPYEEILAVKLMEATVNQVINLELVNAVRGWALGCEDLHLLIPEKRWGSFIRVMIRLVGLIDAWVNLVRHLDGEGGWERWASECDGALVRLMRGPIRDSGLIRP